MKTVCIESPFRNPLPEVPLIGEIYRDYLHDCLRDSLSRGEAPFAGHAYLSSVLNDADPDERRQGIDCHLAWLRAADAIAVYVDFGISSGMAEACQVAQHEYRYLAAWADVGEYTHGFVRGWQFGWAHGVVESAYWRGVTDGSQRDPSRFRP